jgi:ADP-ribosylglycohydrolase
MNDPLRSIWGALIGDACGAPLEFYDDTITEEIARGAMTMPGGGSLRVGPGQITDDGELTLALWSVLRERDPVHGFPMKEVAKAYVAWYESFPFDIGRTCSLAFDALSESELDDAIGIIDDMSHRSEANGSLMRVTPIAVWWASHPILVNGTICVEETARYAAAAADTDARLSHPGLVTRDANAVYVYAVTLLLLGCSPAQTIQQVDIMVRETCSEVRRWVEESKRIWEGLSDARELIGHVRHAFVAALWFLRRPEIGYGEAMCMVLQRGGDTDTNAAIVGGMVACYQPIPLSMKDVVQRFDGKSITQGHRIIGRERPSAYVVQHQIGP